MATWFFRNPRGFALAFLVILAMGWSAWTTTGRQEDPTITNLFGTVITPYPGAEPARVEGLVTEKVEAALRTIPEISEIGSVSRTGLSVVTIDLVETLSEAEIETAWTDVRNALEDARAELPEGAGLPEFEESGAGTFTAISALRQREGDPADPGLVTREAEALADRLRSLPGTELVEIFGAVEEEVLVEIDPAAMAGLGLDADAVATAIAAADAKRPAGRLQGGGSGLLLEVEGAFGDLDRIRRIPLTRGGEGSALRLGDLASVRRVPLDPPASIARFEGRPAVLVAARMEPDLRVDRWAAANRAALEDFAAALPAGVEHQLVFDQSRYTASRFAELGLNLGTGVALVVAVLVVTLGWRAAFVVATALPLAGLISLWGMQRLGVSLHQMSVTGMIVALGLLVDAAIVTTDAIKRRIDAGAPPLEAVGATVRGLAVPLSASTLTTVLAFLPMALLPGPVGDFVGSIAIAVIVMLAASLFLALTLTPALAGWLLPGAGAVKGGWWRDGVAAPRLGRAFARWLALALDHPRLAVLGALALPVTGFLAFPTLTAQFFPGADRDQFHVQMTLSGSPSIHVTDAVAAEADALLRGTEGVRSVAWVVGESAPGFYYNMVQDQDGVASFAEALVTTVSPGATRALIPAVQAELDRALPEAQVVVRELVQGPPVGAPVELRLVGHDLERLREAGDRLREVMAGLPGITQSRASLAGGAPKLVLRLDEDRVAAAGLDLAEVAGQLGGALDGATGGSLVEGATESSVRVRLRPEDRAGAEAVAAFGLLAPGAAGAAATGDFPAVPLAALGVLDLIPQESPIHRRNGERINLVQAYTMAGVLPEEVLAEVRARLASEPDLLPAGVRLEIGGDADARSDTVDDLVATVGLVVVLTLAALVLSLGSFRLTAIALMVAGLSAGLSFLALAVFSYPFGIQALIGVVGSIGVSINAAIIVLSALQEDPRAAAGDRAAMSEVVGASARHILSTTVTTVGGFLPLILAGGGFWPPFAMAVAGGVFLSVVPAFFFTPPMFAMLATTRRPALAAA